MSTTAWVIGGRGLLGHAIRSIVETRDQWTLLETQPLGWSNPELATEQARTTMRALLETSTATGSDWTIIWAAGAAVTASSTSQLEAELNQLRNILDAIGSTLDGRAHNGSIFYASSAGGVYAGSSGPPFSEESAAVPISPYGQFKLDAEAAVTNFAVKHNLRSLLGRIANLYGPGQKLEKMQGLISHIAKAQFSPAPASIYVPLDTTRDYLFVEDCALLICDGLDRLRRESAESARHVTKILASGQGVTIGALLGHFRILSKNHPHVMLGSSASSNFQARDLRLHSVVWPELDRRSFTPLPAGIHATMQDILSNLQHSQPA